MPKFVVIRTFDPGVTQGIRTTWVVPATAGVIMLGILLGLAGHLDRASALSRRQDAGCNRSRSESVTQFHHHDIESWIR